MATARFYDESKDTGGDTYGVPKADLDEETFNAYPDWLKVSIDQWGMYKKSKPRPAADAPDKAKEGE